jgi:hypothetical protein
MMCDLMSEPHAEAACAQGWQLVDMGLPGGHAIQIQDVCQSQVPGAAHLGSHQAAVQAFKHAYEQGADHAIQAYLVLKQHAHSEFSYWNMHTWKIHS